MAEQEYNTFYLSSLVRGNLSYRVTQSISWIINIGILLVPKTYYR